MTAYSGYDGLGIDPAEGFQAAIRAFADRAQQIAIAGSAVAGNSQPLADWRSLCESMDWVVKQPVIRPPVTIGWCLTCGAENRVPLIEGGAPCRECGNPAFCHPARCTFCGLTGGIGEDIDVRLMPCPQCGRTAVERIPTPPAVPGRRRRK